MKDWFKYEFGYVNIDSENIYFTNTGNWSETKDLREKGIQKSNIFRKSSIQFFLVVLVLFFGFLIIKGFDNGKLLLGLPVILFLVYKYLKPELGSKYKVPIIKISNIDIENNSATINFTDASNRESSETLTKVDIKGIQILEKLKQLF